MRETGKHTAGPWTKGIPNYKVLGADGHMVAMVGVSWRSSAEADANVALIAAAPDLLAALEALAGKIALLNESKELQLVFTVAAIHGHRYNGPKWEQELAEAQVAISQATG